MGTESYDVTTVRGPLSPHVRAGSGLWGLCSQGSAQICWAPPPGCAGSSYYDNVRPLAYPDSDAVLICFDISRPETLDSVLKKWQGETQEFCPNAKVVLVGCKLDMRTDLATLRELSKQRLIPVTHEQGTVLAKQVGAVSYVECSSRSSERSVRDVFHVATVASLGRGHRQLRRTDSRRGMQRSTQLSGRPDRGNEGEIHKDRAKSCNLM
ncbi:PREDICTED: rho-related GTP-binding protein RhoN [Rhinopithecus bieti]|uniref:rho-related GTP-binding protein RhoN n=1 Tax=Rhinopithecus bieti TaxID=61621 RepID=UPI00083BE14A|nr:PREDICTED: rho-related GTP-binding protein RhoN [Rhinopithecus bieti]